MSTKYYKKHKNQPTVPETIVIGIGKGLWWLVSLPFRKRGRRAGLSVSDRNYIIKKRQEIELLLNSSSIIELKHAVMEADKLVDFILKKKGYRGETFADRLRNAESHINHDIYQSIWNGHKIRNQIAHDEGSIEKSILITAANKLLNYTK